MIAFSKSFRFFILTLLMSAGVTFTASAARPSAASLMADCAAAVSKSDAVSVEFAIDGNDGHPLPGALTMKGKAFAMVLPGMKMWFDGKTQWTLLESNNEVSITAPTDEELLESNPFVLLSNYSKLYDVRLEQSTDSRYHRIRLSPKTESPVSYAILTVDVTSKLPGAAEINFKNGQRLRATVTAIRPISNPGKGAFTFHADDYRGMEIVDLR